MQEILFIQSISLYMLLLLCDQCCYVCYLAKIKKVVQLLDGPTNKSKTVLKTITGFWREEKFGRPNPSEMYPYQFRCV